jgi:hypothetical protein
MLIERLQFLLLLFLLTTRFCAAQEKAPAKLLIKVDESVSGPFGGEKSVTCLRVFSDGKVLYARWWNSAVTIVDKATGEKSSPEHTISLEHHLEDTDTWDLSAFLGSKPVRRLSGAFAPPHTPVDYIENVTVHIMSPTGKQRQISTREFYAASLEEKSRYPPALIVLMSKIDEIEKEANDKGTPTEVPTDCALKPQHP